MQRDKKPSKFYSQNYLYRKENTNYKFLQHRIDLKQSHPIQHFTKQHTFIAFIVRVLNAILYCVFKEIYKISIHHSIILRDFFALNQQDHSTNMSILFAKYFEYLFGHAEKTGGDISYLSTMCCANDASHQAQKLSCDFLRLTFNQKDVQDILIFDMQYVLKIYLNSDILKIKGKNFGCVSGGRDGGKLIP